MTAQAHPSVLYRRALQVGSVALALGSAAELGRPLTVPEVLGLVLLFSEREQRRYPRASARWVGRFCLERRVELAGVQLLIALLAVLPDRPRVSAEGLEAFFADRGERDLAEVVHRWKNERRPTRADMSA